MEKQRKNIIIVGAGKLGSFYSEKLSISGKDVTVIDKKEYRLNFLPQSFYGTKIFGDATDYTVLEKAKASMAKTIIITTPNDDANILISHIAAFIYRIPNIIVKIDDINKARLLQDEKFHIIDPLRLSIDETAKYLKGND